MVLHPRSNGSEEMQRYNAARDLLAEYVSPE